MEKELFKSENIENITVSKETKQWMQLMAETLNVQTKIQHHLVNEYSLTKDMPEKMDKCHEGFMKVKNELIGWFGDRAFERMLGSGFKEM